MSAYRPYNVQPMGDEYLQHRFQPYVYRPGLGADVGAVRPWVLLGTAGLALWLMTRR